MFALLFAGCDEVFDLERLPPPELVFDHCAPQPVDHLVRYLLVVDPSTPPQPYIQGTALSTCNDRGLELLSINDEAEYELLLPEFQPHFARGYFVYSGTNDAKEEGTWVGHDGCPAFENWALGEPTGGSIENCVAIEPDGMFDGPCGEATGGFSNNKVAGCELPRWPTAECLAAAEYPGTLTLYATPPRSLADASTFCRQNGGKVIEIESQAELDAARALAGGAAFWLGAYHVERFWYRESGIACRQLLPWRAGEPTFTPGEECAAHAGGGAEVRACTDQLATICETAAR